MTTRAYRTTTGKTWHKRRSLGVVAQCNERFILDLDNGIYVDRVSQYPGTHLCMLCFKR